LGANTSIAGLGRGSAFDIAQSIVTIAVDSWPVRECMMCAAPCAGKPPSIKARPFKPDATGSLAAMRRGWEAC